MKIKFLKKEKNWVKEKESFWLNINFYWKLAVGFMFLVISISVFFGYRLFTKVNQELILSQSGVSEEQVKILKKERIKKVLEYFSLKKQKSSAILNYPAPISDPSR